MCMCVLGMRVGVLKAYLPWEFGRGHRCQASPLVSGRSVSRLVGQSVDQLVGRPAGQSGLSGGQLVAWLVGRSVSLLVSRSVGQ